MWIGPSPSREALERRLGGDAEARGLLFEWSMVEMVERYLGDERLQLAYLGPGRHRHQREPVRRGHGLGPASIMPPGGWRVCRAPGATWTAAWGWCPSCCATSRARQESPVAAGVPVARIVPGEGVELESGERIRAPSVVPMPTRGSPSACSTAAADPAWAAQVRAIPIEGVTVKVNMTLTELPNFTARPGTNEPHHTGQVNTPLSKREWRDYHRMANDGVLPPRTWCELYLQTVFDRSVAPDGRAYAERLRPVRAAPVQEGTWDTRREEAGGRSWTRSRGSAATCRGRSRRSRCLDRPTSSGGWASRAGTSFRARSCRPYMWDRRLQARTPMPGVFLCGAGTHPGGSVIGINGRNAAMEVLADG